MKRQILILIFVVGIFSCSILKDINDVVYDTSFSGARLDTITYLGNNTYKAKISPAFEPVNDSPYFAFGINAKSNKTIMLKLNYGKYRHRYIPKLSTDKKTWTKIKQKNLKMDTISGIATLKLNIGSKKIYVAGQEIEASSDTYLWMDNLMNKHLELKKTVVGKTVLNKNNYCIQFENDSNVNAIVLIARQHPPEIPGGSIGFKAFFEELMSDANYAIQFRKKFNIYSFPLLNPDGADAGNWRHNANGVDLNRDWVDFTQPETQMVKNFLSTKVKEGNNIRFAIDFHTSYSGPYMLILDSINNTKAKGIIPKWIESIETNSSLKVEARRRSQELPYCYNYFYNQFGCEAVTYEEGDEIERKIIVQRAIIYAKELMKTFVLKYSNNEFKD